MPRNGKVTSRQWSYMMSEGSPLTPEKKKQWQKERREGKIKFVAKKKHPNA